jgi:hypothetical protein
MGVFINTGKEVGTEGVEERVYTRVDTRVNVEYGT